MRKHIASIVFVAAALLAGLQAHAKEYKLSSPNGNLKVVVTVGNSTSYSLYVKDKLVMENCKIEMELQDGRLLGTGASIRKDTRGTKTESIVAPLYRQKDFKTSYNYLRLSYDGDYILQFRAYNDGFAYRFVTSFSDEITVKNETVEFSFTENFPTSLAPVIPRGERYESSFENLYTSTELGLETDDLFFCPILVQVPGCGNLLLTESDVEDYPGMFITLKDKTFTAEFPPVPASYSPNAKGVNRPTVYNDYIAITEGGRFFPWRIVAYAEKDADLPVNNMVYQTAKPSVIDDISWITPGQSAWDWWNDFVLYDVDFKSGCNTDTYKFHIDFARDHGLEYVILDEGWYKNLNPFDYSEAVDVEGLCAYAREADVKLILWMTSTLLHSNAEAICDHFSKLGVAGFKVDFFDAQDQNTVKQIYEISQIAADHHLVLDLHGMYKPTGLNKTFPNILNFEGVFGLEQLKWTSLAGADMPRNQVMIPYIRMVAGPMDYTQGAMRNAGKWHFRDDFSRPMSQGTRAAQIAAYVVYDSPLVMLCDSPSDYLRDLPTLEYITSIPAVFDYTRVLEGTLGEYIITLREKDGKWYVGGMCSWNERDVELSLDFLPEGRNFSAKVYRDGANVDREATDHKIETISVNEESKLTIHMGQGGGFAMIIE